MIDNAITFTNVLIEAINTLPVTWFYLIGTLIGSALSLIGVVSYIKKRHIHIYAEKLRSEFIVLNVAFFGFLLSIADFVILNGPQYAHLLPFVTKYWPTISFAAITIHAVATAVMKAMKADKPIVVTQAEIDKNFPESTTMSGLPSSSFGSASTGVTPPTSELWPR